MGAAFAAQLAECPQGTRLLAALYALASVGTPALARRFPKLNLRFLCCLATVFGRGYASSVFLAPLYRPIQDGMDLVMGAMELQMAAAHLPRRERSLGSLRFLAWVLFSASGANAMFLLLMKLLVQSGNSRVRFHTNQGLWPLIMVCVSLQSLDMPDVPVNVLGLMDVQSKWYPISLAIAHSALNGTVRWETFAAIAFGHAWKLLGLEGHMLPSSHFAAQAERRWVPQLPGLLGAILGGEWIPAGPRAPPRSWDPWQHIQSMIPRPSRNDADSDRHENFQLFGGPGHRLGS